MQAEHEMDTDTTTDKKSSRSATARYVPVGRRRAARQLQPRGVVGPRIADVLPFRPVPRLASPLVRAGAPWAASGRVGVLRLVMLPDEFWAPCALHAQWHTHTHTCWRSAASWRRDYIDISCYVASGGYENVAPADMVPKNHGVTVMCISLALRLTTQRRSSVWRRACGYEKPGTTWSRMRRTRPSIRRPNMLKGEL